VRPAPILCYVTDRRRLSGGRDGVTVLAAHVGRLARAGIDLVQIREGDLDGRTLLRLAVEAVEAARGTAARIVINDRADVALAAGAAGVHLRGDSAPAARVRAMAPAGWVIGRSVHTVAEAALACRAGAVDYLVAGTTFRTVSKPADVPLLGTSGLRDICRASNVPVLAIGGLTEDTAPAAALAGASGLAAIGLFGDRLDEGELARRLAALRALFGA
jgi:thiamine-phosphate pyrophosphorylase